MDFCWIITLFSFCFMNTPFNFDTLIWDMRMGQNSTLEYHLGHNPTLNYYMGQFRTMVTFQRGTMTWGQNSACNCNLSSLQSRWYSCPAATISGKVIIIHNIKSEGKTTRGTISSSMAWQKVKNIHVQCTRTNNNNVTTTLISQRLTYDCYRFLWCQNVPTYRKSTGLLFGV